MAEMVAKKLSIPFHFVDLSEIYRKQVVDYMFSEYAAGRTPNPDVMCNSKIKFDAFLKCALELGGDYVATGHYCKKEVIESTDGEIYRLMAGDDTNKDQSYFLCQLSQQQLSKALFPIGSLRKPEVREIAHKAGLPSADKKDSQGICFVGKVDLPKFLSQQLAPKEGEVVEIFEKDYDKIAEREFNHLAESKLFSESNEKLQQLIKESTPIKYLPSDGKVIGKHIGVQYYTIGQRHGLNIGGHKNSIFIIANDISSNTIYVGEGNTHRGLYRRTLLIHPSDIHWIREDLKMKEGEEREYLVRIRYRQPLQKAHLFMTSLGLFIQFDQMQKSITPGQFAAWYSSDLELEGSGVIG